MLSSYNSDYSRESKNILFFSFAHRAIIQKSKIHVKMENAPETKKMNDINEVLKIYNEKEDK